MTICQVTFFVAGEDFRHSDGNTVGLTDDLPTKSLKKGQIRHLTSSMITNDSLAMRIVIEDRKIAIVRFSSMNKTVPEKSLSTWNLKQSYCSTDDSSSSAALIPTALHWPSQLS